MVGTLVARVGASAASAATRPSPASLTTGFSGSPTFIKGTLTDQARRAVYGHLYVYLSSQKSTPQNPAPKKQNMAKVADIATGGCVGPGGGAPGCYEARVADSPAIQAYTEKHHGFVNIRYMAVAKGHKTVVDTLFRSARAILANGATAASVPNASSAKWGWFDGGSETYTTAKELKIHFGVKTHGQVEAGSTPAASSAGVSPDIPFGCTGLAESTFQADTVVGELRS